MAYEITISDLAEDYLFYADYFSYIAEAGLNRARTLFPGIALSTTIDITSITNRTNADVAMANFTRMFDTSYEYLWTDGQHFDPIRDAFDGLGKYIKKKSGLDTVDEFLTQEVIQVRPTYASFSNNIIGETIDKLNDSKITISVVPIPDSPDDLSGYTVRNILDSSALAAIFTDTISLTNPVDWRVATGDSINNSSTTVDYNLWVKQAMEDNDLDIFVQVDLLDGTSIPVTPKNFANSVVRNAYQADVLNRVALYQPTWLNLSMETQKYLTAAPSDFANFVSLFRDTRSLIQSSSPNIEVMVSWQYEDLLGLTNGINSTPLHVPRWENFDLFEPYQDVIGITSYPIATPDLKFGDPDAIPDEYYRQLREHTDKKIVFAEFGFAADAENGGTVASQGQFLRRFMTLTEDLRVKLVNWWFLQDTFGFGAFFDRMGLYATGEQRRNSYDVLVNKWGKLKID